MISRVYNKQMLSPELGVKHRWGCLWLTYTVNTFQSSITGNLTAYETMGFEEHSLIPVISIVSNVISAVAYMVFPKILNLWNRSYGYLACCVLAELGLVLSAVCTDIYTYCAAQLYVLGEGLMIRFRPPDHSIGWMIFTQIFIAFGDSSFTCVEEVAVLAAGSHNDSAAMLAFLSLFGYYGGAVGNSISGLALEPLSGLTQGSYCKQVIA
ncbi:hypothetical protein TREMEDRAFT_65025 [Tremella mesenterica DSM 1558]|uniref:uncharacterized protein n=1 Tax=Tremella mesenterica (strain ATCC 24925 / CBS 8224 / DSM 1558 / NBRC 9311 / NRRL Y-6157 / RJB 2259-6 / UBC 559-6) TaxID=578456 RepID=UPI00032BDB26|nr:uncharacterized protein TREMEDRAFT_65025 [Tremella mesenterica DSM 1558]EIW66643.1 hypothetical protein TREMEDRAFT_65025 [Tremella mesenterica DSM 1558]